MFDARAKSAFMVAMAVLAVSFAGFRVGVGALNVYLKKEPVELRQHFDTLPTQMGAWRAVARPEKYSAELIEELGTDVYLDRVYERRIGGETEQIALHLTYYTGLIDAVPHVPDRCLVAHGYNLRSGPENVPLEIDRSTWIEEDGRWTTTMRDRVTGRIVDIEMPQGDFAIRTSEFNHSEQPDRTLISGYFFIANHKVTPTPEGVRRLAFNLSERYAYYCKVQFTASGGRNFDSDRYLSGVRTLLEALLPDLMRCLPDWSALAPATEE